MQSTPLKVEENLTKAEPLILNAIGDGAQIIVLPEMFNVGFYFGEDLMTVAETLDGRTVTWLKSLAKQNKVYITSSIYEYFEGHFFNTMVMVGYDGNVQCYRKRNPTWFEVSVWRRADKPGPGIFETPFGRIGGVICFDSFSRETYEGLKNSAVNLVIIVACWGASKSSFWRPDVMLAYPALKKWAKLASTSVPSHYARKLKVPTVFVNQGGYTITSCQTPWFYPFPSLKNMRYDFCGKSNIRDSNGNLLVQAKSNQDHFWEVESIEIDLTSEPKEPEKVNVPNHYLKPNYYIVQPPLIAKTFQAVFTRGLQEVYENRRQKYSSGQKEDSRHN
jgi:predicted amidohydrolase